ncbi:TetR family transcriptional regulator [Mesorhizobium sp. L-8-10]|uniref:TetR/AcrR family transcriptional regulator n=1 Tax=unclassified Mesorhizobium TaxID=325217 RepID=UPI001925BFE7|nr:MULTISPECIES: TetR/AcrR family transcriptional regulator [unclassified Mesorhizobium]BCH21094.1 TetR family transcriptional regulator [Mesorhizobium sp. L-8-3]BCH28937.1 TetR family transcriptional regulator [Mesorhizobium sp. L-8-10]
MKTVAAEIEPKERVAQILEASARIFASKGYDGTSMRDISESCGISKSLLYHHFQSKDELYTRVAQTATQELYSFVEGRVAGETDPIAKIRAFMIATAEYFHRYRWAWIASTNAFWSDPKRHRQKERMMRRKRYEEHLRALIREAIEAGKIRNVDEAMAGRLILSSLNWMHRWYDPSKPATPQEIADMFFDFILHGLEKRA